MLSIDEWYSSCSSGNVTGYTDLVVGTIVGSIPEYFWSGNPHNQCIFLMRLSSRLTCLDHFLTPSLAWFDFCGIYSVTDYTAILLETLWFAPFLCQWRSLERCGMHSLHYLYGALLISVACAIFGICCWISSVSFCNQFSIDVAHSCGIQMKIMTFLASVYVCLSYYEDCSFTRYLMQSILRIDCFVAVVLLQQYWNIIHPPNFVVDLGSYVVVHHGTINLQGTPAVFSY